jgi:Sulfatase
MKNSGLLLATLTLAIVTVAPTVAQQIEGVPGSPSATTTIDGKYLPPPPPKFGGEIGLDAAQSKPYWPPSVVPPKGAPNVLLIMTDDAGYGVSGTFGGVIPTPTMDRIARMGLRYTQFHSTALCSPTRAALITGRNHHSVGFGVVSEQATGFPGYDSIIGPENATIGRILQQNGYATSWFGKEHNTPSYRINVAGPFDQWPVGMGFDYFYGFMGGESDQWEPYLFRNQTQIFPWIGKPGYNLVTEAQCGGARQAVLSLLRARRYPRTAPAQAGVDREVQGQVRHGLERVAREGVCTAETFDHFACPLDVFHPTPDRPIRRGA